MARPPTIGAGLNELDNLLSQLDANQAEQTPQQQVRGALGAGITAVLTAALAVFIGLVGMRPTTCEDTCAATTLSATTSAAAALAAAALAFAPLAIAALTAAFAAATRMQSALHLQHARTHAHRPVDACLPPLTIVPSARRCSWARDGLCDDTVHPESINLVCSAGSDCADCGPRDTFWLPHWAAVTVSLLLTALVVLGLRATVEMFQLWEAQMRGHGSWARIPLTDAYFGISFINKLANSTQVCEKGLKASPNPTPTLTLTRTRTLTLTLASDPNPNHAGAREGAQGRAVRATRRGLLRGALAGAEQGPQVSLQGHQHRASLLQVRPVGQALRGPRGGARAEGHHHARPPLLPHRRWFRN